MAIAFNSNVFALRAIRSVADADTLTNEIVTRLSSGMRINSAKDDAAGLAVASALAAHGRVYTQAIRNGNDALSLLNVAQGANEDLSTIAERLKELASQAANGTFTLSQRRALNTEAYALTNEFNRMVNGTRFNNMNILSADAGAIVAQLGYGTNGTISSSPAADLRRAVGSGAFGSKKNVGGTGAVDTALGDLNNDGFLDVISISGTNSDFGIALGNGDGTFKAVATVSTASIGTLQRLAVGDMNGDGASDLVIGDSAGNIQVFKNTGGTTFTTLANKGVVGASIATLDVADFNRDGVLDIISAASDTNVYVSLGNGDGLLQSALKSDVLVPQGSITRGQVGDFNGDGIPDFVSSISIQSSPTILLGKGDGTFTNAGAIGVAKNTNLVVADFDRDGFDDIVTSAGALLRSNGDGTFTSTETAYTPSATGMHRAADFNGDGFIDILHVVTGGLDLLLGNGDGTFQAAKSSAGASAATSVLSGDFNGDGVLDALVGGGANPEAYVSTSSQSTTIQHFDLLSQTSAREALTALEATFARIEKNLGTLGSSMTRISSALSAITATRDNYAAAYSRIVDADVAQETARMARISIVQNAATAILAQANQQPAIAMRLLQ